MFNFFITKSDDGYSYLPSTAGYAAIIIIILALLIGINLLTHNSTKKKINPKQLAFASLAIALATVASYLKIFSMPNGGTITLFSMLFIVLIGYWYGAKIGIMTAIGYGLIQLFIEPYIIGIPQLFIDYIFAFGALGISGFFNKFKNGLLIGYIAAVIGRFFFATISGYIFFGSYAPEGTSPIIYSLTYNASYILPEAIITLILITIPPVQKALQMIKKMANE